MPKTQTLKKDFHKGIRAVDIEKIVKDWMQEAVETNGNLDTKELISSLTHSFEYFAESLVGEIYGSNFIDYLHKQKIIISPK